MDSYLVCLGGTGIHPSQTSRGIRRPPPRAGLDLGILATRIHKLTGLRILYSRAETEAKIPAASGTPETQAPFAQ